MSPSAFRFRLRLSPSLSSHSYLILSFPFILSSINHPSIILRLIDFLYCFYAIAPTVPLIVSRETYQADRRKDIGYKKAA